MRGFAQTIQDLHLYGAAAIASMGWTLCEYRGLPAMPWTILWFCGALLAYNVDRLQPDPADPLNVPLRAAHGPALRRIRKTLVLLSAATLLLIPLWHRDWLSTSLILAGGAVCCAYSLPLLGKRIKQVPVVKTLFAPTIVAGALLVLPQLKFPTALATSQILLFWGFLMFNMLLCDLRDLEGDRATGVRSIPVLLGEKRTRILLWVLLVALELQAFRQRTAAAESSPHQQIFWAALVWVGPLYLASLLIASSTQRRESFYEWWVEGMLWLPFASWLWAHSLV